MKLFVLGAYVVVMLTIGYLNMRKTRTVSAFFLGDRSIGPWISAMAYGTTYFSAVLFIGYAGKIGWGFGLSSLWIVAGNALIGGLLAWKVLAERTRSMTSRLGAVTMPEFLSARYDSWWLKPFSAIIVFAFLVPYSASVYKGLSFLFDAAFPEVSYNTILVAMGVLTAAYLIMGGYKAVAITDSVQGTIMLIGAGLLIANVVGHEKVGGLGEIVSRLSTIDPKLAAPVGPPGFVNLASLVILTSLGCWGLPQMVQKFYAIKSKEAIRRATVVVTIFAFVITTGAYLTGALTRLFFDTMPGKNPDMVMPALVSQFLPDYLIVIVLLLVLSASMSTLAGLVLVSSSALAIDMGDGLLWNRHKRRGVLPDVAADTAAASGGADIVPASAGAPKVDTTVVVMRVLCFAFVAVSLVLALTDTPILALMSFSWGTVAGAFLAPYVYGLVWKRGTREAAWVSMLVGLGISIVWGAATGMDAGKSPLIGSVAMLVPMLVFPIVSLVTPAFSKRHIERCFGSEAEQAS